MMPASTRRLVIAACLLSVAWLWIWRARERPLDLPSVERMGAPPSRQDWPSSAAITPAATAAIDSTAWLRSPPFYPDRNPHSYLPGGVAAPPAQVSGSASASGPDYEVTTTVVGTTQAFAVLRPTGSNQSMIARRGEALRDAPGWRVTGIGRFSIHLIDGNGQDVELRLKPHAAAPVAPMPAVLAPMTASSTDTAPASLPPPATQPAQGDAGLRARIQARRRAASSADGGKVQ